MAFFFLTVCVAIIDPGVENETSSTQVLKPGRYTLIGRGAQLDMIL